MKMKLVNQIHDLEHNHHQECWDHNQLRQGWHRAAWPAQVGAGMDLSLTGGFDGLSV
jgi:hypothetical protein